jgi:large subunit ribosomal protein L13
MNISGKFVILLQDRARKLRIFVDDKHPFADKPLQPYVMPPRNVRELRPRARRALERAQKKAANREAKLALLEQANPSSVPT